MIWWNCLLNVEFKNWKKILYFRKINPKLTKKCIHCTNIEQKVYDSENKKRT